MLFFCKLCFTKKKLRSHYSVVIAPQWRGMICKMYLQTVGDYFTIILRVIVDFVVSMLMR